MRAPHAPPTSARRPRAAPSPNSTSAACLGPRPVSELPHPGLSWPALSRDIRILTTTDSGPLVDLFGIPGRPGPGGNAQLTIKGTLTVASGTVPSPPTVYALTMIETLPAAVSPPEFVLTVTFAIPLSLLEKSSVLGFN